jgi:Zn-dependent peptidase ImmA (M78 family)
MIRAFVERLLKQHQLSGAPVNVEQIARALGAEVQYEPTDDELSGFLFRDTLAKRAIIGVNANHHPNRQRFSIAHEIGHLLLHEGERIHIDRIGRGYHLNWRDAESGAGTNEKEMEANLFAAELLMPKKFLDADLAKLGGLDLFEDEVLGDLAKKYEVSVQAMTHRLTNLEYIL